MVSLLELIPLMDNYDDTTTTRGESWLIEAAGRLDLTPEQISDEDRMIAGRPGSHHELSGARDRAAEEGRAMARS